MKTVMSAICLALVAAGGVAAAQEAPKVMGDLTRAEAQARAIDSFGKLDINHDGKLDAADRTARVQQMFDRIDIDHDGQISRTEFAAARQHGPGGKDGAAPAGLADEEGGPRDSGQRRHGMGMHHGPMMMHMARMADTNHDGAVSKDEFVAAVLKRFDREDANHDGVVTHAERQAAHMAMREKWRTMHGPAHGAMHAGETPPPPAG